MLIRVSLEFWKDDSHIRVHLKFRLNSWLSYMLHVLWCSINTSTFALLCPMRELQQQSTLREVVACVTTGWQLSPYRVETNRATTKSTRVQCRLGITVSNIPWTNWKIFEATWRPFKSFWFINKIFCKNDYSCQKNELIHANACSDLFFLFAI